MLLYMQASMAGKQRAELQGGENRRLLAESDSTLMTCALIDKRSKANSLWVSYTLAFRKWVLSKADLCPDLTWLPRSRFVDCFVDLIGTCHRGSYQVVLRKQGLTGICSDRTPGSDSCSPKRLDANIAGGSPWVRLNRAVATLIMLGMQKSQACHRALAESKTNL